jgi:glycosyltransferase involved in cell wall biosynthesis
MAATESVNRRGSVFVTQIQRAGQIGPVAQWITAAGWAGGARRRHGDAWVATPDGVLTPDEALLRASQPARSSTGAARRRRVPEPVITAAKDARRIPRNRRFADQLLAEPWDPTGIRSVFQFHGLLFDAGLQLARRVGAPSVLVVDSCQVEEARAWGVHRPGWSGIAERAGERPQFVHADLVVCVSEEVAESVRRRGWRRDGVVVVPNGVDTERFTPGPGDPGLRARLGLDDAFVVGWAGSFRSFHGLDTLLEAAAVAGRDIDDLHLLLVGDGLARPALEARARELGVRAVFTGTVPFADIPDYMRAMDVATVLADPAQPFHYSPVKLREYQACGRAVVASAVGEMQRELRDGETAAMVDPGDATALADTFVRLARDPALVDRLGTAARADVVATASWEIRFAEVEQMLGLRQFSS